MKRSRQYSNRYLRKLGTVSPSVRGRESSGQHHDIHECTPPYQLAPLPSRILLAGLSLAEVHVEDHML